MISVRIWLRSGRRAGIAPARNAPDPADASGQERHRGPSRLERPTFRPGRGPAMRSACRNGPARHRDRSRPNREPRGAAARAGAAHLSSPAEPRSCKGKNLVSRDRRGIFFLYRSQPAENFVTVLRVLHDESQKWPRPSLTIDDELLDDSASGLKSLTEAEDPLFQVKGIVERLRSRLNSEPKSQDVRASCQQQLA
jgi:hypothetical protein